MRPLVLLSGGMDSAVCLYLALDETRDVRAVGFDYGQRHSAELDAAARLADDAGVPFHTIKLPPLGTPATTGDPVVPNRNAVLISLAAWLALRVGSDTLVMGACAADQRDFPDCRPEFFVAMQATLRAAGYGLRIVTPLIDHSKADVWKVADELGRLGDVRHGTVSCYAGDATPHTWGSGCAECPACRARERGWLDFRLA